MISIDAIQELFDDIKEVKKWNIDEPLRYGYFFLDNDLGKLNILGNELEKQGYTFVETFEAEPEETDELEMYYLHVEKIEIHSVESLFERNKQLYRIADEFELDSYDGFDIGEV